VALKRWQRNEIFKAVQAAGLSPEEFGWDVGADESSLRHLPSGAYFVFGGVAGNYVSRYQAVDGPVEERTELSQYRLMQQVEFWLGAVKREIETPDLWAQLQREAELFGPVSDDAMGNTSLTTAEQKDIAGKLRELKDYISRTYSLSELQTQRLEEKFDYLTAAASRVGRKDWLFLAAGVMVSYFVEMALPPEVAKGILKTLLASIGNILGSGPLGLP
jgi:hypothetical protein